MDSIDSERAALGSALIDSPSAGQLAASLEADMFYSDAYRTIFEAIKRVRERRDPVDVISVANELRTMGKLEDLGGMPALFELIQGASTHHHMGYYISAVKNIYYSRLIKNLALNLASDPNEETINKIQSAAVARAGVTSVKYFDFSKDLPDYMEQLENQKGLEGGFNTGLDNLDGMLNGLHRGDLMVVAARPGGGKTAMMTKFAANFADAGLKVVVFSTEMPINQFVNRVIPFKARIEAGKMRRNNLSAHDFTRISDACSKMHGKYQLFVSDLARPGIPDIKQALIAIKPDIMIVDYLQRCYKPKAENNTRSVDEFMAQLKTLAKEHQAVVVLGCQLNRIVDRGDGAPRLSDLRDSGAIEAEADQVILLSTEAYDRKNPPTSVVITADVAKNRHGEGGAVELYFHRSFVDIAEHPPEFGANAPVVHPMFGDNT